MAQQPDVPSITSDKCHCIPTPVYIRQQPHLLPAHYTQSYAHRISNDLSTDSTTRICTRLPSISQNPHCQLEDNSAMRAFLLPSLETIELMLILLIAPISVAEVAVLPVAMSHVIKMPIESPSNIIDPQLAIDMNTALLPPAATPQTGFLSFESVTCASTTHQVFNDTHMGVSVHSICLHTWQIATWLKYRVYIMTDQ